MSGDCSIYGGFVVGTSNVNWGDIQGEISNQSDLMSELDKKVDKIDGKGLSTNDYDNTAKETVDSLGTASKCNTGTSEGNVPIINSEGKIDSSILPPLAITDTFTAENQEQTGNHNQGNDTFGFQIYLCQTYESVDYCCISGILRV